MAYRVEWYYELIREWQDYREYFFRRRAINCAARKVAEKGSAKEWRVVDTKTKNVVVSMWKQN